MATIFSTGKHLDVSQPVVMGILNATPNSFFNKGQNSDIDGLLHTAEKMLKDGATILDIGGASTKPGEPLITADEELQRVMPAVTAIHNHFPDVWLSIDTYNAKVARETVAAGIAIVNDISAGEIDSTMLQTVAELQVAYIAMHMQGLPQTMQENPQYHDVVTEVKSYLENRCKECEQQGISSIIIDPGFGFGKTVTHNFQLLRSLHTFQSLGRPVLAGLSRKSIVCKPLKVNPEHALNGTTALNMAALQQGANILRVHDVKEAMQVIKLYQWLKGDYDGLQ